MGQARTHKPHPKHRDVLSSAFLSLGFWGSLAVTSPMAFTGHISTHFPQPLQVISFTSGIKLVVCTGFIMPNLWAASMASQQHPQQLHMKFTLSRDIFSKLNKVVVIGCLQEIPTLLLHPPPLQIHAFIRDDAAVLNVIQMSKGASHALPI